MTNEAQNGVKIAKFWWPIVATLIGAGFGFGVAWTKIGDRVERVEVLAADLKETRDEKLPEFESMQQQIPGLVSDSKWVRANLYNLLIIMGIKPVEQE